MNRIFSHSLVYVINLSEDITIPGSVKTIDSYTFNECSSLNEVILPEGLTTLGSGCFENCTGLSEVKVPESVEMMENYVFSKCRSLKSVTLPDGLVSIGMGVFENCSPDLVVCCTCGSEGEAYARAGGKTVYSPYSKVRIVKVK